MIADGDWIAIGAPVNESEARAFATIRSELEKCAERFTVASNIRLLNGRADFFEYDAIVVGERMIFVIEVKGYGGRIECQRDRWYLSSGDYIENPGGRVSIKAKQLKTLLLSRDRSLREHLWVQDFVYVNGIGAKLTDADYARRGSYEVLGNTTFDNGAALGSALRESARWYRGEPFTPDQRERIVEYLRGGKQRKVADRIGQYLILERLIATSERYERLLARNRFAPNDADRAELHVYRLDGRATQAEELERQFKRQIQIVTQLGNLGVAPRFLEAGENTWNSERVPYIAYEWLGGLESLGDRIGRSEPSLRESLKLAIALADSIATMHEQGIVHGALEPSSLFLRSDETTGDVRVVIGRIELARPRDAGMSVGPKSAINAAASTYASPDVLENKHPDIDDDLFSFGAILAHILRGRPMFAAAKEILQKIRLPRLVENASADPPELVELVKSLLARSRLSRPGSMRAVATQLRALLAPLEARREDPRKIGNYTILRELRAGATGRTVVAERVDRAGEVVLKIADISNDESVRHEIETLRELQQNGPQSHIVLAYDVVTIPEAGKTVGEFMYVRGEDGERLRGKIVRAALEPLADSLFSALAAVHERGFVHRDVKPANLMVGEDGTATLIDFGLACASGDGDLVVGTAPYKSERLFERETWLPMDDVFAAATTIWEIATAQHPWDGESPSGEPRLDLEALGTLVDDDVKPAFVAAIRDLLTRDDTAPGAAGRARAAIASALRAEKPALELALPIVFELPEHTALHDAITNMQLGKSTRRALDDLGATTLDDVLSLDNARFSSIRAYGRGVTDEIAALRLALVRRFGEPTDAATSTLRSVRRAFAPALVTDAEAAGAPLDVLGISASLREALRRHAIETVAALAGADPGNLERDERIGSAGVHDLRERIHRYADDREGVVVDAVLPVWAAATESDFIDGVARMGGTPAAAIDLLERAGGFVLGPSSDVPLRHALVAAPPWTEDGFVAALRALSDTAAWPPCDLATLARAVEMPDAIDADARAFFVERLVPALARISVTADNRYYAPEAASLADFLAYGAQTLALPAPLGAFVSAVEKRLNGLRLPSAATDEFARALDDAGFSLMGGAVERTAALVREGERKATMLGGADIMALSSVARALMESTGVGGYRLVVAEPACYAARTRALVNELRTTLGDRLRIVDLDAELYRNLKGRNRLQTAIIVQRKAGLRDDALAAIAGEMTRGILDTLLDGTPNTLTILINAGSLGLTGAAQHLGRIYDAARGQSRGLVVVCVPGDHPNDHARLNRVVPLPIQPTEKPMALECVA